MLTKNRYDVVIIGAGVGGLVCGCYLAKNGFKTLIVEKNKKPGGYCTSFEREGYFFDAAAHSLGSCRKGGVLNGIIKDLGLDGEIEFCRRDPTDKVVMPDKEIFIYADHRRTYDCLAENFFNERANIKRFFDFVLTDNFAKIFVRTVKYSFADLLDSFFSDRKLKSTISVFLGNIGLSSLKASALVGSILLREYVLDGGYYPKGGMQAFSDLLAERYRRYGGEIVLGRVVLCIEQKDNVVSSVKLDNEEKVQTDFVVSNVDAFRTFNEMLKPKNTEAAKRLFRLKTSISAFACYLGITEDLETIFGSIATTWYFTSYDVDRCYGNPLKPSQASAVKYLTCLFMPTKELKKGVGYKNSVTLLTGASAATRSWQKKASIADSMINLASSILPGLSKYIGIKIIATPEDFYRFTYNHNGSMFGWASTPDQINKNLVPQKTIIDNLYLAGHWATTSFGHSGIPLVALSGKNAARAIARKAIKH